MNVNPDYDQGSKKVLANLLCKYQITAIRNFIIERHFYSHAVYSVSTSK